ncbi:MAG: HIT domain-containing protein, partial [Chthoniobacterales bacterium]|nr:HIT domain-containing protein [Chthoniobacterales bacterium]
MTIFERIVAREIAAEIVYEDDDVLAFHDVNPQAPVHVLIVPKRVIPR